MIARSLKINWRRVGYCAAFLLITLFALRLSPKPDLAHQFPSSRTVFAADGELLRMTLAYDEQYRLWTPLTQIAAPMQEAALLYEDRWFYWHPGVNPWSLVRASFATVMGKRRIGGSSISMQLARRVYHIDSRTVNGKLRQVFGALWLELRYSKHDILEAYLNSAPYGGNVEGVGAASMIYWRKSVRDLTVPEALNLAVIPQNPRKRVTNSTQDSDTVSLIAARQRLAQLWLKRHPDDARLIAADGLALPFQRRSSLPFLAPHLVDHVLRETKQNVIQTTLHLKTQKLIETMMRDYVKTRADQGIKNASAILIDASKMEVKALVGSIDYHDAAIAGQVNGVLARRSPGSALKPFIYALALDQGLIHSGSILKDAASNFGAFAPENFDGRFTGPIPAHLALIRSRNIPAVDLASRLSRPNLYDFLKLGGVQKLAAESHYGLALALGGAEISMEELATLYASLLNQGQRRDLHYFAHNEVEKEATINLLSPEAAYITVDMLRQNPRPDTFAPARPAIAWKTGTSWGFRDAWTAGVFGRYVLVVWVGNFDGSSNPALIGIEAAAPLFLRIVDALRAEKLDKGEMASSQPEQLKRLDICVASGDLPNAECPVIAPAWFITGKSPIRESSLHRKILIDTRTGRRACSASQFTREEVFEYWPSDMLTLFNKAGMPLRKLPEGRCPTDEVNLAQDAAPSITSPLRGVSHIQRATQQTPIYLRAEAGSSGGKLSWFVDDSLLGQAKPGEALAWLPPKAGRYTLRVLDSNGLSDSRQVVVMASD
ncbi:MAG: penicillin-binding protein 1C [Undibacterium sp.]|nr:penicillin-binding protein 1C [Undibacterium sp.]